MVAVPAAAVSLVALPIRLGGLGLRLSAPFAAVAHVALNVEVSSILRVLWPPAVDCVALASDPTLCRAFALLPSELISSTPFEVLLSGEQVLRGLQRKWSAGIISTQFNAVWAGATAEERVRLLSLRCPLGGAWLQGRVGVLRQLDLLGADEFRTAIRHRLGLPLCASESVCACGATRDVMGRHAQKCLADGAKAVPHNAVRDELARLCEVRFPGLVRVEARPFAAEEHHNLRLDIVLPSGSGGCRLLDVAIIDPLMDHGRIELALREREEKRGFYALSSLGFLV